MRHSLNVNRLHIFWSSSVSWKMGIFKAKIVENNAYPMWGRSKIESGERLFYRNDFFSVSFKIGTYGFNFHWYPRYQGRKRPTQSKEDRRAEERERRENRRQIRTLTKRGRSQSKKNRKEAQRQAA